MIKTLLAISMGFMSVQEPAEPIKDPGNQEGKKVYLKAQYAGNAGLASIGFGSFFLNEKLMADISYGYLPGFANDVRVHTFSFKPAYNISEFTIKHFNISPYAGIAATWSAGHNIYLLAPDHYPRDYYYGNAFHFNPFVGLRSGIDLESRRLSRLSLYAELGTADYELLYAFRNREIKFREILNLCFGVMFHLNGDR